MQITAGNNRNFIILISRLITSLENFRVQNNTQGQLRYGRIHPRPQCIPDTKINFLKLIYQQFNLM